MTLLSKFFGALAKLPPARTTDVGVERNLETKMPDGVVLVGDRWFPRQASSQPPPIVLIRTPYGRKQFGMVGRLFAERGYQAFVQSTRGTFGSGGVWEPFRHEREDGRATLDWLAAQPWFGGSIATFGPSYLGQTQWAVAEGKPGALKAMAIDVSASHFRDAVIYPGGSFALETLATWMHQVEHQEEGQLGVLRAQARTGRVVDRACRSWPLGSADRAAVGHEVAFYQDWLAHDPADAWWDVIDFRRGMADMPPASLVGGWYDPFLPIQVDDFVALRQAGIDARLTIGQWTHTSPGGFGMALRDAVDWFDHQLREQPSRSEGAVRLFVMGDKRWVTVPDWPPPADVQRWHLDAGGRLTPANPTTVSTLRYRYDPRDPTPSIGGPSLNIRNGGRKDQRRREARPDVLTFTSDALSAPLTVAGPLSVELHARSSVEHMDFFVRLCDVSPKGRSTNISDGIVRLGPDDTAKSADGSFRVRVGMWPTAITFGAGHRIRLQVSSGAHPLFVRHSGTGEPLATATSFVPADQEILCGPDHPSGIDLPTARL